MKKPTNKYFIEVTDTFGGEANYSWVTRHIISANNERGAINKFSRASCIHWRKDFAERYNSKSGATCCFVNEIDNDELARIEAQYSRINYID